MIPENNPVSFDITSFDDTIHPIIAAPTITYFYKRFASYDRSPSTGLDYAVNRHYDSQQGRFTQIDPIGIGVSTLENPQTRWSY